MDIHDNYQQLANAVLAMAVEDVVQYRVLNTFHPKDENNIPQGITDNVGKVTRKADRKFPCVVGGVKFKSKKQYIDFCSRQNKSNALCKYREMEKHHDEALSFLMDEERIGIFTNQPVAFFKWAIEEKYRMEMQWEFEKIFCGQPKRRYARNIQYARNKR